MCGSPAVVLTDPGKERVISWLMSRGRDWVCVAWSGKGGSLVSAEPLRRRVFEGSSFPDTEGKGIISGPSGHLQHCRKAMGGRGHSDPGL